VRLEGLFGNDSRQISECLGKTTSVIAVQSGSNVKKKAIACLNGLAAACAVMDAALVSAKDFYAGKTLTIVVGHSPGAGDDTYARFLARHMGCYVAGAPNIVVENMPGASGMLSVNRLYTVAPCDGTVFGSFYPASPLQEAVGNISARYKSMELSWIGSMRQSINVLAVMTTTGVKTLEDTMQKK